MFDLDEFTTFQTQAAVKPVSPVSLTDTHKSDTSTSHSPNTPVSTRAQNLMMQYHDYTQHHARAQVTVGDDGHNFFGCPRVWEKIVSHPRFDEVEDLEALCAELNAKVRVVHTLSLLVKKLMLF